MVTTPGADSVFGGDEGEAEVAQAVAQAGGKGGGGGQLGRPVGLADGGIEGLDQVGGMSESDALMFVVPAEVQIAGQGAGGADGVIVEDHAEAGIAGQPLAAGAGGEVNPLQVDRHQADGADAVGAQLDARAGAEGLQSGEGIQHAGGGFANGRTRASPRPEERERNCSTAVRLKDSPQRNFKVSKVRPEAAGVIDQPLAKFTVAEDQPRLSSPD